MTVESHELIQRRHGNRWFRLSLRSLPGEKRRKVRSLINWLAEREARLLNAAQQSGGAGLRDAMMALHREVAASKEMETEVFKNSPAAMARINEFADAIGQRALRTNFKTSVDLDQYCRRYAGSVGRLLGGVLDAPDELARDTATAIEKIRLVRDFDYHLQRGWVPLPLMELEATPEDFQRGLESELVRTALIDRSQTAMEELDAAREQIGELPDDGSRRFVLRWIEYYRSIGQKCTKISATNRHIELSLTEKARIFLL